MAGKALPNFADFVAATAIHPLTKPDEVLNDAIKRTYGFFSDMVLGRAKEEMIRGGVKISEWVQLAKSSQAGFYQPGEELTVAGDDTLVQVDFQWRFMKNVYGWVDQEVMLNEGDTKALYKRIAIAKRQNCVLSGIDFMEDAFISAVPVTSTMETSTGTTPYCLRAFITEAGGVPTANATVGGITIGDGSGTGTWTTVAGASPTTYTRWKNQVANYNPNSPATTLRKSFGTLWRKLKFKAPKTKEDFFKNELFRKIRIWTSADGQDMYETVLADGNDSFAPKADAGGITDSPVFRGLPVEYIEAMDDIGYTAGQPRYFFPNLEYLFPVFHQDRMFEEKKPVNGAPVNQPESWKVFVLNWYQVVCRSRYRQGIIVPSTTA